MFKNINFGKAAGEQESAYYPDLINEGFYNYNNAISKMIDGEEFLIQGYKGSGKSTIAEKISSIALAEPDKLLNAKKIYLKDYPFTRFNQIYPGSEGEESKFPRVWSYLLLSILLNLIYESKDGVSWGEKREDFDASIEKLRALGILSSGELYNITMNASRKSFKVSLPKILEFTLSPQPDNEATILFDNVIDVFKKLIHDYKSDKTNIILIDGLDDVILEKGLQLKILSALIFEANNINREFKTKNINAKICILIRVDLYEKLPSGNKNKSSNDSSILLNWYNDVKDPVQTHLIKGANLRARLATNGQYEITDFFNKKIEKQHGKETLSFLLNHTRHTPRDFFQLLKFIQQHHDESEFKVSDDAILNGIRAYSHEYFLPEITDEVSGHIELDDFESFLNAISIIKQREFKFDTLLQHYNTSGNDIEKLQKLLGILFKCSAIGHKFDQDRYEHVYWNKYARFDIEKTICLHRGMWKALNLI